MYYFQRMRLKGARPPRKSVGKIVWLWVGSFEAVSGLAAGALLDVFIYRRRRGP